MLCFTKIHLCGRTRILKLSFLPKRVLTQGQNEVEDFKLTKSMMKSINKFLIPPMTTDKLKENNEITALIMKTGHVSWAKVSTQTLSLTDWNFQSYPIADFRNLNEASVLEFAHSLVDSIPPSDLYVMEKMKTHEESKLLNEIRLSSMLMVLLNDCYDGAAKFDKVIFQSDHVMNKLYKIFIGRERVSSRKALENILEEVNQEGETISQKNDFTHYLLSKISLEYLELYDNSSIEQQESLSSALLLISSFIDVFVHHNEESLSRIIQQYALKKQT